MQALIDAVPSDRPHSRVENRQSLEDLSPRELERRRRARQDHLRTHPEDETADPEVDF